VSKSRSAAAVNAPAFHGNAFTEAPLWKAVGAGWRPLFGDFRSLGFSFEWHDFWIDTDLDWARSFHPGSLELCLNLEGQAVLNDGRRTVELSPRTRTFYFQGEPPLRGRRLANEQHRFITVEFAPEFLRRSIGKEAKHLHPCVQAVVKETGQRSDLSIPEPLQLGLLNLVESLRQCPVFKPARETWFRCKALELAAQSFFCPPEGELFCTRQQRAVCERVARVREILTADITKPPSLEALGQMVGCSPFYLSRQFSESTGTTIQQFIRETRLEKAAKLLRAGQCNVTEAALEVGYSSLSHFTVAFRERFGCCPGLYVAGLKVPAAARPEHQKKD